MHITPLTSPLSSSRICFLIGSQAAGRVGSDPGSTVLQVGELGQGPSVGALPADKGQAWRVAPHSQPVRLPSSANGIGVDPHSSRPPQELGAFTIFSSKPAVEVVELSDDERDAAGGGSLARAAKQQGSTGPAPVAKHAKCRGPGSAGSAAPHVPPTGQQGQPSESTSGFQRISGGYTRLGTHRAQEGARPCAKAAAVPLGLDNALQQSGKVVQPGNLGGVQGGTCQAPSNGPPEATAVSRKTSAGTCKSTEGLTSRCESSGALPAAAPDSDFQNRPPACAAGVASSDRAVPPSTLPPAASAPFDVEHPQRVIAVTGLANGTASADDPSTRTNPAAATQPSVASAPQSAQRPAPPHLVGIPGLPTS